MVQRPKVTTDGILLPIVKYGVWSYYAPGLVGGIPVWIPLVWAYLFCFYRRLSKTIHTSISKKWPDNRELRVKLINGMMAGMIMVYYVTTSFLISKKFAVTYFVFTLPAVIFWHKKGLSEATSTNLQFSISV